MRGLKAGEEVLRQVALGMSAKNPSGSMALLLQGDAMAGQLTLRVEVAGDHAHHVQVAAVRFLPAPSTVFSTPPVQLAGGRSGVPA